MGLWQADLRALANLPATPAGRRVLLGTLLGLGMLALLWWSVTAAMHQDPRLVQMLHRTTGSSMRAMLGSALMPCPIAATWLGLALAQRQLFETPELLLWRTAPLPGWRPAVQVLLRACFLSLLWASALSVPFVVTLLRASPAGWLAAVLVPVAVVCCTVPLLATLLAVQIVLVRFFAGRVLRLVLAIAAALASVGFSTWLLVGLFTDEPSRAEPLAAAAAPDRLPWIVGTAADLLTEAANGRLDRTALRAALGWLGLALGLFWFTARLHPRAVERHLESQAPLWRRRRARWPAGIAANLRRKELAQVLQQPGALLGFVVFAVLVFALARERVLVDALLRQRHLPAEVSQVAAMATLWFLAVMLVLYAHMGRLVLWDGAQWPLYQSAPASSWQVLRGKLEATATFLAWPLVLVAAAGAHQFGAGPRAVLTFVGLAVGGTLVALGVLAVVGTWPRLMRPGDGAFAQGGRSFVAALLLVALFQGALVPAMFAWLQFDHHARRERVDLDAAVAAAPWVVGAAIAYGLVVAGLGTAIGARNFRRLTAPQ